MCKEANRPGASCPLFAQSRSVAGRVQPALKNTVSKGAAVTAFACPLAELRAGESLVGPGAGVTAACLFTRMKVRAFVPVVDVAQVGASVNLQIGRFERSDDVKSQEFVENSRKPKAQILDPCLERIHAKFIGQKLLVCTLFQGSRRMDSLRMEGGTRLGCQY